MSEDDTGHLPTTPQAIEEDATTKPQTRDEQEKEQAFDVLSQTKDEKGVSKKGVNMSAKVYSPSRVYFDGLAFSITATNETGEFDILPKHHPFICLLNPCDVIVRSVNEGSRKISISGGLMHVKEDKVIVFLDI
jgi:hypothetical protein